MKELFLIEEKFESSVISYSSKTIDRRTLHTLMFESSVISYSSKTS